MLAVAEELVAAARRPRGSRRPAWSPAAAAGEPGWTSKKRSPTNGVASQAIEREDQRTP